MNPHDSTTDTATPAAAISWIDRADVLQQRLHAWAAAPLVALDTEFIRERTWYPQLALVQLAIPGEVLLVDPCAAGVADVLHDWLDQPSTSLLMHSASEDLQALQRGCGALPAPLYDTQIAAALAGHGAGIGYQKLVEQVTGVVLAKGETRSDWLRRPLSPAQLQYAADDVLYLHRIHAALDARLGELDRRDWLTDDCARMIAQARRDEPERWPHLALRGTQYLDPDAQARLLRLLRWRELQARASDKPRGWILDNELAIGLARKPPLDIDALRRFFDSQPKAPRKLVEPIWEQLAAPLTTHDRDIPLVAAPDAAHKARLKRLQQAVVDVAARLDLPEGLLASRRHLETLLERGDWPDALSGWRRTHLEPVLGPILIAD